MHTAWDKHIKDILKVLKNQPLIENEVVGPSLHGNADSADNEEDYVGEQANEEHRGTGSASQNQIIHEQMKIMQQQIQALLSGSNLRVLQQGSNVNWQYPCPSDSMHNPYFFLNIHVTMECHTAILEWMTVSNFNWMVKLSNPRRYCFWHPRSKYKSPGSSRWKFHWTLPKSRSRTRK